MSLSARFLDAMRFVEEQHAFPAHREDVHGERFRLLLEEAGLVAPLERIPSVVVAGSAGKASTARMIASVARAALDRAGDRRPIVLGTKPPLSETPDGNRERWQILGGGRDASILGRESWIEPDELADQVEGLRPAVERVSRERRDPLAPYDLRYAILARLASTRGAALVVVEANIGLRSDVAGRWPGQRVNVLTRIGTEHESLLRAPEALAAAHPELTGAIGPLWQKASGVARGVPVVLGPQASNVEELARAIALDAGAREVVRVGERCAASNVRTTLEGSSARLDLEGASFPIALRALGAFQIENARTAVVTCSVLAREGILPAPSIETMREGLRRVVVPGRLDLVDRSPATLRNVTEGASKARSLVETVRTLGVERFVVCASVLARVDGAAEIVETLASAAETIAFVATAHGPDDLPAIEVHALARRARGDALDVRCEPDARAAVALARRLATEEGTVLLVGNGLSDALNA